MDELPGREEEVKPQPLGPYFVIDSQAYRLTGSWRRICDPLPGSAPARPAEVKYSLSRNFCALSGPPRSRETVGSAVCGFITMPDEGWMIQDEALVPSGTDLRRNSAETWALLETLRGDEDRPTLERILQLVVRHGERVLLCSASPRLAAAASLGIRQRNGASGCQLYAVDTDGPRLCQLWRDLSAARLSDSILLYHGNLGDFFRDLPTDPTLVCVSAGGALDPLYVRNGLPPGALVFFIGEDTGHTRGIEACLVQGLLEPAPGSRHERLFRTTRRCSGHGVELPTEAFGALRGLLHGRYFSGLLEDSEHTAVADLIAPMRRSWVETVGSCASGYNGWPYSNPLSTPLPETMANGVPWPKISIVTPSLNQGKYIEQTILSVANQGYPNVEHIIIDGGSTDETTAILERYRDRLTYVVSEPDRGQSHAINKGMAHATGRNLTWLNSDDMLAPGALAAMAMAFFTSGADMVAGVCQLYSDGTLVAQHMTSCQNGNLPLNDLLDLDGAWNAGQFFYQPEVMFTRELWERAGGHVDESLYYSMDYELWIRFAEAGARLHVIGRPVAWFRIHPQQKTHVAAKFQAELREWRGAYLKRSGRTYHAKPAPSVPHNRLRILMLNDHGFKYGAGIAHQRLAEAIAWAGHEVFAVALVDEPLPPESVPPYTNQQVLDVVTSYNPDLVIVGNLHSAKPDPSLLSLLAGRWPTLCILHDLWLLTGRCGYTLGCTKYLQGCDETCPTPHEYPQEIPNRIAKAWSDKRELLNKHPLILLANSQWTADFVRRTLPAPGPRVETIHLSFPLDVFQPLDKLMCRQLLDLPEDRFIVLATSEFSDRRKGVDHLLKALQQLQLPDLLLVSTSWSEPDAQLLGSIDLRRMGYIADPRRMALIYAAADLLVGPSLEETFGQIFIEAIACGTPVIGYPVTAVPESLVDNVTGRLAAAVGPDHLAAAILDLYRKPALRRDMAYWGRLHVENEWSPFAAYRHLFVALQRLGLLEKMQCPPKISFLPIPAPAPVAQALSRVQIPRPSIIEMFRIAIQRLIAARGGRLAEARHLTGVALLLVKERLRLWRAAAIRGKES
jgi:glycosyltransferase involved in cell wall biosynthesis